MRAIVRSLQQCSRCPPDGHPVPLLLRSVGGLTRQASYEAAGDMYAVVFDGPRDMRVRKKPRPALQAPTDAIVKVSLSSICGSDMHPYAGRGVLLDKGITFGHEFMGQICAVGDQVQSLKPGLRVASAFTASCGGCFNCTHELTCRCEDPSAGRFGYISASAGIRGPEGTQTEYVRVPLADSTLVPVSDTVSDEEALLAGDILSTGWYCASKGDIAEQKQRYGHASVAIVGCGPVGLMALLAAQAQGATQLLAVDRVADRLALARKMGAQPVDANDAQQALQQVKAATGGRGVDCALEAVGSQATLEMAFKALRPGGTLSSVGLHTDSEFTAFSPWDGYNKNFTYRNGRCPARCFMTDILGKLEQKFWGDPFPGLDLITHRVSIRDEVAVRDAYHKFEHRLENCTKVVMALDM